MPTTTDETTVAANRPLTETGTTTRTIRIEREVDELLRRLASDEHVSVNHLVNRSLRRLVEWDAFADKFGIVSVPSALYNRMMDGLSEDQARELGGWVGKDLVREFLTFWFKEVSIETAVGEYPRLTAQYGRAFQYEEHHEGGRWVVILKHGSGRKWSVFYGEFLRVLLSEVGGREPLVEISENQAVARFLLE